MAKDNEDEIDVKLDPRDDAEKIDVVLENPVSDDVPDVVVTEKKKDTPKLTVDEGINELKQRLAEERQAREAAEARAKAAMEREAAARVDVADTNLRLLNTAIETLKNNEAMLKTQLRDAHAVGDFDTVAEVSVQLNKVAMDRERVLAGKRQHEERLAQSKDPVEQYASLLKPQSAAWIRSHPETVTDARLNRKMVRAHEDALDEGIREDTPEYFAYVEQRLGMRKQLETEDAGDSPLSEASGSSRRASPNAAPVSRSPLRTVNGKLQMRLTAAEQEAAEFSGLTYAEYAMQKAKLLKEGR